MAIVGFATLFSGVINGYFAAASTGALLTFVLPVTLPAPNSAIPDRLEGWGARRRRRHLRGDAALAASPRGPTSSATPPRAAARSPSSLDAGRDERWPNARPRARRRSTAWAGASWDPAPPDRPDRPDGGARLASRRARLAPLLPRAVAELPALELACAEDDEALAAAAAVLRASAGRLEGRDGAARLRTARHGAGRGRSRARAATAGAAGRHPGGRDARGARAAVPDPGGDLLGAPGRRLRAARDRRRGARARPRRRRAPAARARRPRGDRAAGGRARQRPLGVVPEQRPRRRRARDRGLHRPADRAPARRSGSCSGRSPCCGRTRSAPAGRSSARSPGPPSGSSSAPCS